MHEIATSVEDAPIRRFHLRVKATDTLRAALDAMVSSRTGVAVRVRSLDDGDRYEGILTQELVSGKIL